MIEREKESERHQREGCGRSGAGQPTWLPGVGPWPPLQTLWRPRYSPWRGSLSNKTPLPGLWKVLDPSMWVSPEQA